LKHLTTTVNIRQKLLNEPLEFGLLPFINTQTVCHSSDENS